MDSVDKTDCSEFGREIIAPANAEVLDSLEEPFVQGIAVVQLMICVIGTVGNCLSLVVLSTTKSLHTIPNLYIGVLAAIDLIICLLIPVSIAQVIMGLHSTERIIPPVACTVIGKLRP